MDFLEIRRKAKEEAAAQAQKAGQGKASPELREPASAAPVVAPPTEPKAGELPSPPPAGPDAGPVLTESLLTVGRLAAELQGLPEPGDAREEEPEPQGAVDARFTTWRPGAGERPFVPLPEPAPEPTPAPSDFAVFDPTTLRAPQPDPGPVTVLPLSLPAPVPSPSPPPPRTSSARSPDPYPPRDPLDEFFYHSDEELPASMVPASAAEPEAEEIEDAGVEEYLTFLLGAEEFAVAIERVREVLKSQQITEVPRAPAGILGVVTVRGDVVAVFDPRLRLGLPGPTPEPGLGRIIIVDDGEGPCGLLVDVVASVVRLPRGSIEPTPQGIGGAAADCLAGIGREGQRLFTVLDLGTLLRRSSATPRAGRAHAGA